MAWGCGVGVEPSATSSRKHALSLANRVKLPARAGLALLSLVNESFGPSQQFSKLILIDQKIEHGGQRTQSKRQIPHGQSPLQDRSGVA